MLLSSTTVLLAFWVPFFVDEKMTFFYRWSGTVGLQIHSRFSRIDNQVDLLTRFLVLPVDI